MRQPKIACCVFWFRVFRMAIGVEGSLLIVKESLSGMTRMRRRCLKGHAE